VWGHKTTAHTLLDHGRNAPYVRCHDGYAAQRRLQHDSWQSFGSAREKQDINGVVGVLDIIKGTREGHPSRIEAVCSRLNLWLQLPVADHQKVGAVDLTDDFDRKVWLLFCAERADPADNQAGGREAEALAGLPGLVGSCWPEALRVSGVGNDRPAFLGNAVQGTQSGRRCRPEGHDVGRSSHEQCRAHTLN
jgi:hypothetical protein